MKGRRVDYALHLDEDWLKFEPGDYGKNLEGIWFCRPPTGCPGVGSLAKHTIVEHEDGTITVSPSILCGYGPNPAPGYEGWHGYLERGVWRSC